MRLFNIFKKKSKQKESVIELSLEDFQKKVTEELSIIKASEKKVSQAIREKLTVLISLVHEKNDALKKYNIDEIKEREKIKAIVKVNLKNYCTYVDRLLRNITSIEDDALLIPTINTAFHDFKKKSQVSYEKATYLIGGELGEIKEAIKLFFNELDTLMKENKEIVERSLLLRSTEKVIHEIGSLQVQCEKKDPEMQKITKAINQKKNLVTSLLEKKEAIRHSKEYKDNEKKEEEKKNLSVEIDTELLKLKQDIDFKALIAINHHAKKEMAIIQEYKEHFVDTCKQKSIDALLPLIKDAQLLSSSLHEKIKDIQKKQDMYNAMIITTQWFEEEEKEIARTEQEILEYEKQKQVTEKQILSLNSDLHEKMMQRNEYAKQLGYIIKQSNN